MAVCEVFLYLSSVLSMNTLALLFIAACCVGIASILTTPAKGGVFFAAVVLLGYFILPNKMYLLTFSGLAGYVLVLEGLQPKLLLRFPIWAVWVVKLMVFNAVYIPVLLFAPQLIYSGEISFGMFLILFLAGNAVIILFDYLYVALENKYGAQIHALTKRR